MVWEREGSLVAAKARQGQEDTHAQEWWQDTIRHFEGGILKCSLSADAPCLWQEKRVIIIMLIILTSMWRCQVAERVRTDARVTVMERTNLRYVQLGDLPEALPVDLATLDLSFISLLKVLPAVVALLQPRAHLLALIKPQFEAGRDEVRQKAQV